jgi:hypothetical protein
MAKNEPDLDVFINSCFKCTKLLTKYTNHTKEERQLLLDESLVLLVRLVPVAVFLLWLELVRQLLQNRLEQLLLARLVVCITVPDCNLDRVPADRVRNAADVIVEGWCILVGENKQVKADTYKLAWSRQHPAGRHRQQGDTSRARTVRPDPWGS